ncbi:SDR family oxidoreductase [Amphritea sp. HPY]|uniref:SDR family oxidoreductase n=1 Tax=Amphritea sp. HPY TaxID=3421652 RepID=UPI003D7E86E7
MNNSTENRYRFDGKVVVVTGAGNGLGRSHAKLFASLGARVVANDLGVNRDGSAADSSAIRQSPVDDTVAEITAAGGLAVANYDSVEVGERIIEQAMDQFGQIDVVVNNAGIIRDKSFHKMELEDWQLVQRVHLEGAYRVTRAAWPHLRDQGAGKVLFTASASGLYGNFGQANYSAAKAGLFGLTRTLAVEGAAKNIQCNIIAPMLDSRMLEGLMPDEYRKQMKPELVSPLAAFLCHDECLENGSLYEVGAGWYAKVRWQRSDGFGMPPAEEVSVADIAENWTAINNFEQAHFPKDTLEAGSIMLQNLNR